MKLSNIISVVMALSMIVGCSKQQTNGGKEISYKINEKEDVINSLGIIIKNREKLDAFINKKGSSQRVVHYTIEGDPIFNT
jgi:5-enolpyruvylshikimate-3-phosphate synthase